MFDLLESMIKSGIVRDMSSLPIGAKKENEYFEKFFKNDESVSYECVWRKITGEKIAKEKMQNYMETCFKRKVGPIQLFEHIETGILYDGKITYPDSQHNDLSGHDFQKSSFIDAHVGMRTAKELGKIYKMIIKNRLKIKRMIGTPDFIDIEIVYIDKIFVDSKNQPMSVKAMEIKSHFYIDHS